MNVGTINVMNAQDTMAHKNAVAGAQQQPFTTDPNQHLVDMLSSHIDRIWQTNRTAKMSGIQTVMMNCLRQRRGEYTADKIAAIRQQGGSEIFMMLTNVKCRAAESWVRDVIFPESGQRPFEVDPTPVPDLPPEISAQIQQIAQQELQMIQAHGLYPTPEKMRERIDELKDTVMARFKQQAKRVCKRMEDEIDDTLTEGEWYKSLDECISDFVTYPSCIIKGPVTRKNKRLEWRRAANGQSVPIVQEELTPFFYRVAPPDFYPSADSKGPNDGNMCEHIRFRRNDLYKMIGVPGYNEQRIRAALAEYKDGYLFPDVQEQEFREQLSQDQWWSAADKPISGVEVYCNVPGALLLQWGMPASQVPDPMQEYPIVALKVGRFVVRCIVNDDPLGRRPYEIESFEKVVGSIWGQGVPQIMSDLQDICNATARNLINNMAIASGPMVEVEVDRLAEGETIEQLYPWRIVQTKSGRGTSPSPAVRWNQPDIIAAELMQVYTFFSRLADDYTGVPAYAYGSSSVGGAATTSSGLSQLMGNAARGIKRAVARIDNLISGTVQRTHTHIMMYVPDTTLHGDIRIVARGAASLVAREQQAMARNNMLQATANPFDFGIMGPDGRANLLRAAAESTGVDEVVPDEDSIRFKIMQQAQQQQAAMAAAQQPPPGAPGPGGPPPGPPGQPGQPSAGPPPPRLAAMGPNGVPAGGVNHFQGAH
jgi:hypothetical protein